jgi:hypothetical protein
MRTLAENLPARELPISIRHVEARNQDPAGPSGPPRPLDVRSVGGGRRGERRACEEDREEASASEAVCEKDACISIASQATGTRRRAGAHV